MADGAAGRGRHDSRHGDAGRRRRVGRRERRGRRRRRRSCAILPQHVVAIQPLRDLDAQRLRRSGPSGSSETRARAAQSSGARPVFARLVLAVREPEQRFVAVRFLRIVGRGLEIGDRAHPMLVGDAVLGVRHAASIRRGAGPRRRRPISAGHGNDDKSRSRHLHNVRSRRPVVDVCILTTRSRCAIRCCTRSQRSRIGASLIDVSTSTVSRSRMTRATSVMPRSCAARRYSRVSGAASRRARVRTASRRARVLRIARGQAEHDQLRALEVLGAVLA